MVLFSLKEAAAVELEGTDLEAQEVLAVKEALATHILQLRQSITLIHKVVIRLGHTLIGTLIQVVSAVLTVPQDILETLQFLLEEREIVALLNTLLSIQLASLSI